MRPGACLTGSQYPAHREGYAKQRPSPQASGTPSAGTLTAAGPPGAVVPAPRRAVGPALSSRPRRSALPLELYIPDVTAAGAATVAEKGQKREVEHAPC